MMFHPLVNRRAASITLLLLIALLSVCACQTAVQPRSPPATTAEGDRLSSALTGIVPADWVLSGSVLRFTPQTLYEHINGNAELYLAYDVAKLTFASYEQESDPSRFIDLFVYDMGPPTNAFGIFSGERFGEQPPVGLGRLAYRSDSGFFIWKDRYYIQVIASEPAEGLIQTAELLAKQISASLIDKGEAVWGRTALPAQRRIPGTTKFFLRDAMGLDFMTHMYTSEYQIGRRRVKALLSKQRSAQAAQTLLTRYREYASQYGKGADDESVDGISLLLCDMGRRYDVLFQKGALVGGILSAESKPLGMRAAMVLWRHLAAAQNPEP